MRTRVILSFLLVAIAAHATTPDIGKDRLRRLVKLPVIVFQPAWTFDPEQGFAIGSEDQRISTQISALQDELTEDTRDAARYRELGGLYLKINEYESAHLAWNKSVTLYRRRVELQPENAALLTEFGQALFDAGKRSEAESVLRRATGQAPKDWKAWVALGSCLDAESRRDLTENPRGGVYKPASSKVGQAEKWLAEAGGCFDKAVAAAPEEGEVYFHRAMHRSLQNFLRKEIQRASDRQEDADPLTQCFSEESLSDFKRAGELCPKDYRRMANLALFEIYTAKNGKVNWREGLTWNSLPDRSQRLVLEVMSRLENLGQSPDAHLAAGALEALGILQGPVLQENRACLASLRRAVALDPDRDQAWEALAATLSKTKNYAELLTVCEDRVRKKDAAHNHLLLAKACEKMKLWDTAEEEVLAGLKEAPNDFSINLSLAALLLKRSQNSSVMLEINGWLGRSEQLLSGIPETRKMRQQTIDLALTRSIYYALNDDVESARKYVKIATDKDKENDLAQEILSAMTF